jgi:hypothetical protein
MNTNTTKQTALTWWNSLNGSDRIELMKKHGFQKQGGKPWQYRSISDKGILNIYLKENAQ